MTTNPPPFDDDIPDPEEQALLQRRLFTYSSSAVRVGLELDAIYVQYPAFKEALIACDRVAQLARDFSRAYGALVAGPPGTGKTSIIKYFRRSLPQSSLFEVGLGAISIRLQYRPTPGQIVSALLKAMRYPFAQVTRQTVYIKRDLAFDALRQKGTRIVFADEGHHLATQVRYHGREGVDSAASDVLREMMDEAGVGLVITADASLKDLKDVDPALNSRIATRLALSDFAKGAAWYGFVRAFCRQCTTFELSPLCEVSEMDLLWLASQGNLRSFKNLITEAVMIAVDAGHLKLDRADLALGFKRYFGAACERPNPHAT